MAKPPEPPFKGPWSDLPPPERPKKPPRQPFVRRWREPPISNWRGLLIILFLLFLAPWLASWASHLIIGMMQGQ